ncbi:MAG: response regulator, partial [Desulfobacterales bacterium]|nr:response regulator [Desulfobacterales bacterium]
SPENKAGDLQRQVETLRAELEKIQRRAADLEEANAQWQVTFDAIADAICVLDADHRIVRMNRAMAQLVGRSEADAVGHHCWKLVHGTDQPPESCPCQNVRRFLKRHNAVIDHNQRWIDVTIDPRFDYQGQLDGFIHVMSDVTASVFKEDALREAHHTLLTVLDSIDAIIYAADMASNEVIFMNRHMRDMFAGSSAQTCCQDLYNQDGPCQRNTPEQLLDENGQPRGVVVWEGTNKARDRWFLHHDRAIKWVDGRYVCLHVATDISAVKILERERMENETRLRQAQKMEAIGTLAGGIAHDFNNILSAILGYSELALDDASHGRSNPTYINQVLRAGQRAHDLVQQILTFSRQTETEAKPIQIQPIIKEALKLLRPSLPSTIDIQVEVRSQAIVHADPIQIHQVIMNLCTNASHAMRQGGGRLRVALFEEDLIANGGNPIAGLAPGRYLKMEVSDTGHGIDPLVIDRIFDPYFTTKEKGEGTGMGLAVVQGIVRGCGGAIKASSRQGNGAVFSVYLPIIEQAATAQAVSQECIPQGHERILFVDDEAVLADLAKEILGRLGYRVTVHTDSIEALSLFEGQSHAFDLIMTDMTMPQMTGDAFAERCRAIRPDIPIVICTGYSQKVTPAMMNRLGIDALIMKPLARNKLGLTVRQVLDDKKKLKAHG